jgi:hypothetical protein
MRKPSAYVPFTLAGAALALVLGYVAVNGVARDPAGDEGAAARLFQLILTAQAIAMVAFAARWLRSAPRPALVILALQAVAAAIAIGTVIVLES